ncbi:MAG TPA: hypothetical protein VGN73_06980 [Gemmatimonadaceae bacterium]|nr:hypothetical protein [Gemmatimonadaceae bacterium]
MIAGYPTTAALLALLVGCGSSDGPVTPESPVPPVPALESIPFAALGSGKIAFERISLLDDKTYGATYVVDATAASSTHTFDNAIAFGPALSPDGGRLAYTTYANSNTLYDVYVANTDGTGVQHVTSFPTQEGSPSWTPDGSRILTVGTTGPYVDNIFSQSVVTPGDVLQLTHFTVPTGPFTCPTIIDNDVPITVSPQGLLAFACLVGEIDILSPDGSLSASYKPARNDRRHWPNVFAPKWSPDGTRLAAIETTSDSATNYSLLAVSVKVMNADGTNVTTIASGAGSDAQTGGGWVGLNNFSLCWTADGSHLVFNVPEHPLVGHLWVVRADGSGLTQLTSAPGAWDRSVSCSRS